MGVQERNSRELQVDALCSALLPQFFKLAHYNSDLRVVFRTPHYTKPRDPTSAQCEWDAQEVQRYSITTNDLQGEKREQLS